MGFQIAPMIDVVFVILLFFMVKAGDIQVENAHITKLPGTEATDQAVSMPDEISVMIEDDGLPGGALWESCAIMAYLCGRHRLDRFYPTDPARRATIDSAMFYATGTLYPLVARAVYPALGFPLYPGEVGASDASDASSTATPDSLAISMLTFFPSFALSRFLVPRQARSSREPGTPAGQCERRVSRRGRPLASWASAACRASYRS